MCCAVFCVLPGLAPASDVQAEKALAATSDAPVPPPAEVKDPPLDTELPYGFPGEAMDEEEDYLVRYADGHLTVDVLDMPLQDLLTEVGRQSGARVRLEGLGERTVTDTFTRLSLDAAMRRLVTGKNFSLTYAEQRDPEGKVVGTRLKELTVYGGTGSVSTYRPSSTGTGPSGPTAAGPGVERPGRGQPPGGRPATTTSKTKRLEGKQPQPDKLAETPEEAPPEYANPVTAAILGGRGAPLVEPVPVQEELLPFPDEFTPPHEGVPPFHEELEPLQDELPPPDEDFEGEPSAEDAWYPESEGDDVMEDDGAGYEESEYQ